ncbi:MAG TPA: hypothetical protein VGV18_11400 [Verrucomicrobiae bacterium]|nr:hypothetical protein [Verrucomicrobiae bacterium]
MSLAEITDALPKLSTEELQNIERALISTCSQRRTGIIYDDAYGVWTEENQVAAADDAFALMDAEEQNRKEAQKT